MSRRVDLNRLRANSIKNLDDAMLLYDEASKISDLDYELLWYIGTMVAVDIHATWERFAEKRLIAALNHDAGHFLHTNEIRGVTRVPVGLATVLVRGASGYFDFRSTDDLINKASRFLEKSSNPFHKIPRDVRNYLDTLSGVRNRIVHRSELASANYKRLIRKTYGIKSAPEPEEFLSAIDYRVNSPARKLSRLHGFVAMLKRAIQHT